MPDNARPSSSAPPRKVFYGYWIIAVAFVATTLNSGMAFYGFSVINGAIVDAFGWTLGSVMVAFSIFMIVAAAISPVTGRLADRAGPRRVVLYGTIILSLSLVLLSRTSALWNYYALHIVLGVGHAFVGTIPFSILASSWFHRLRGTMQGIAFTGVGFGGFALAPLIGNYLIPNLGWSNTYLVLGLVLAAVMFPLALFIIRDHPADKGLSPLGLPPGDPAGNTPARTKTISGLALKEVVRTSAFWAEAAVMVVYGAALTAPLQNTVSIFTIQGFKATDAITAVGIIGLVSAMGKTLFGWMCDRMDARYTNAICLSINTGALVVAMLATQTFHLWLYAVLLGLAFGGWAPNMAMLTMNYFGPRQYGSVLGFVQLAFLTGEALGPALAGVAFDRTGGYGSILIPVAVVCTLSIPVIATLRRPAPSAR